MFDLNTPGGLRKAQEWAAQQAAVTTAVAEAEPELEGWTDVDAIETAVKYLKDGKTDAQVRAALAGEFENVEQDADEFIKTAHAQLSELLNKQEAEIEAAQTAEDEARKTATEATDKRLEAEREARKQLVEKVFAQGRLKKPIDPNDMRYVAAIQEAEEKEAEAEETFDDATEEPFPECPVFTGPLTELAKALYPSLPLEFKQIGLVVRWGLLRSGIDKFQLEQHLQPRFNVIMVSLPNRGKTAANNETRKAIDDIAKMAKDETSKRNNSQPTSRVFGDFVTLASADSGPFLVGKFYELVEEAKKQVSAGITTDDAGKIMFDPDEISDVFEKARSSNGRISTLFTEFLKLHSTNRTGNGTKMTGDKPVDKAHLAIFGGATIEKYKSLWTGTGAGGDGLMSRFIPMTTNASQVPPIPLPTDMAGMVKAYERLAKLALLPGQEVTLDSDAVKVITDWWASIDTTKKHTTRVLEMVKQLLIVLAVTNAPENHTGTTLTVGPDLMRQAVRFGNYIIAARERLNPADSWSHIQAMENAIIEWMHKNAVRKNPKTRNEVRRGIHPQRMPGGLGAFKLGWDNCVNTGVLKVRDKTQRDNKYSL